MSKINRVPYAFQSFLGNTAQGTNPDTLLNDVRPVLDLDAFYSFGETRYTGQTKAVGAIGQGLFFVVPEGEAWSPIHIGAEFAGGGTGASYGFRVTLFPNTGGIKVPLARQNTQTSSGSTEQMSYGFSWPQKTLYGAGTIFGIYLGMWANPTVTMIGGMEYVKYDV